MSKRKSRPRASVLPEPLEPRLCLSAAVVSLVLVDADTDEDIMILSSGMVIDEAFLPSRNVNIRAEVEGEPSAVRFGLNADPNVRTESSAPYAIAGDDDGDYRPWQLPKGRVSLSATPLQIEGEVVTEGEALSIRISVHSTAPSKLNATPVSWARIDLDWKDNSTYETGFLIERSVAGVIDRIDQVDPDVEYFVDTNVEPGVEYDYRVAGLRPDGSLTLFSGSDEALVEPGIPASPINPEAVTRAWNRIELEWDDASGNEQGFIIERSINRRTYVPVAQVGPNVTEYVDDGLAEQTWYYYRVRAFNPAGASGVSSGVRAETFPRPPLEQRPGAHNTGYTGSLVDWTGDRTLTEPGVYENYRFAGNVRIAGDNITLRNCEIIGSGIPGSTALSIASELDFVLVDRCEIRNGGASIVTIKSGVIQNCNIHTGAADGIGVGGQGVRILNNWIHHPLGTLDGSHADGIQMATGTNVQIIGNYIDMPKDVPGTASNACIIIKPSSNVIDNVFIQGNWMNGGNFSIFVFPDDLNAYPPPSHVTIMGNWFGRENRYGVKAIHNSTDTYWDDNRWWDTGELIP